jgi:hypothetical protein
MQGLIIEKGIWPFILVTILIGGWTAWRTGKGVAEGWGQVVPHLLIYTALLGIGVRFINFALYGGAMFSLYYFIVNTLILLVFSLLGFRFTRTKQMSTKYYWLYEKTGPFSWKKKSV